MGKLCNGKACTVIFLIFTGMMTRGGRIRLDLENPTENGYPTGMEYSIQENRWMDENLMLQWISKIWKPISQDHPISMIILDSCTYHLTTAVMGEFAACNTEVAIIPAGYTSKLQPMDVGVNKPLKAKIRGC